MRNYHIHTPSENGSYSVSHVYLGHYFDDDPDMLP